MKFYLLFFAFLPLFAFSQSDFEKGQKLFAAEKYNQSKIFYENDLKQNPGNLKSIECLGDIQSASKNWEAALPFYENLKNLKPNVADYQYKYGGVLSMIARESNKIKALGMIGDIKSSFLKALKDDPKHVNARWGLLEYNLAVPGILGGSVAEAENYAIELSQISPIDGLLAKGRIAEYKGNYASAERYYKQAIQVGASKRCYQKLADLYKNKLKQPEKAKKTMLEFDEKNKS